MLGYIDELVVFSSRENLGSRLGPKKQASASLTTSLEYSSVICLHIVSVFPQTDPVF